MGMHDSLNIFLIMTTQAIHNTCMLLNQLLIVCIILDIFITIAIHLLTEIQNDIHKLWIIGCTIDHIVKLLIGLDDFTDITALNRILKCSHRIFEILVACLCDLLTSLANCQLV